MGERIIGRVVTLSLSLFSAAEAKQAEANMIEQSEAERGRARQREAITDSLAGEKSQHVVTHLGIGKGGELGDASQR